MSNKNFLILSASELTGEDKIPDKVLLDSLEQEGQIFPLFIYGNHAPYLVIDGHKRLKALQELEQPVECLYFPDYNVQDAVVEGIRANSHRGLTMEEKAVIVQKLLLHGVAREIIEKKFLKLLKLPHEKRIVENLLKLVELPTEERRFFQARNFGEYLLCLIFNLDNDERSAFLSFAGAYGLNHNQGRDILEKLLQLRSERTIRDTVDCWQKKVLQEPEKAGLFLKRFITELDAFLYAKSETWHELQGIKSRLPKNCVIDDKEYLRNGILLLTSRIRNKKDSGELSRFLSE